MGEKTSVGGVVGYIERRIALILRKQPPPTQIPTNLTPIARHMVMVLTITSRFIESYNKVNPRREMWGNP
jgi:hypothetical protein